MDDRHVSEEGEKWDVDDAFQRAARVGEADEDASQVAREGSVWDEDLDEDELGPTSPFGGDGDEA